MPYKVHELGKGTWIEIYQPREDDLAFLLEEFPEFHPTHLEDSFQPVIHPKMDLTDSYLFMSDTVHTGFEDKKKTEHLEVSIFLTKDALVTITPRKVPLFEQEQVRDDSIVGLIVPETPQLLAYRFFERLYDLSSQTLSAISHAVQRVDARAITGTSVDIISEIAILQRNMIYFITTVEAALPFFEELERKDVSFSKYPMREYWGDIIDKLRRQRAILNDNQKLLTVLSSMHEMVLNRRTNRIITLLTIFSVIFLPLNLITGAYGMNVTFLPFATSHYGFLGIVIVMVALGAGLLTFFKVRRWI